MSASSYPKHSAVTWTPAKELQDSETQLAYWPCSFYFKSSVKQDFQETFS